MSSLAPVLGRAPGGQVDHARRHLLRQPERVRRSSAALRDALVAQADARLADAEGHGLERLVAQVYEERSRRALGDFALTRRIDGYWDRSDVEIDLVALDEDQEIIRFGTCKRSPDELPAAVSDLGEHAARFIDVHPKYRRWRQELVAVATRIGPGLRAELEARGAIPQDLVDLTEGL